ncbi:MAG: hypothetical protein H5T69_00380 [Chloroflexi bacterium]|nr:hypothetical protein [Chloroflexota bacterium]
MEERARRNNILWGVFFILAGIWLGLGLLGFAWARMEHLWPILPIGLGVVSLISGLRGERDEGAVWFGVAATLVGLFFLYITLGPAEWGDMRRLWPILVLIGAVAWLVAWIVDLRQVSNLVMALIAALVGALGLAFTFGRLEAELGQRLLAFWPVILILIGLGLVIQFLVRQA